VRADALTALPSTSAPGPTSPGHRPATPP
jgi:hypothetical protein